VARPSVLQQRPKCSVSGAGSPSSSSCTPPSHAKTVKTNAPRTNASPIYLVLFISATYILNRPCVYCSLLLAILVISLFDFNSSWFEPRYSHPSRLFAVPPPPAAAPQGGSANGSSLLPSALMETLDFVGGVINGTATSVVGSVIDSIKGRSSSPEVSVVNDTVGEWVKSLLRKEWRISCFDVALRL
jgi:Bladder cancer-related protein BC10